MKIIYLSLLGLAVHIGGYGQQLIKTPSIDEGGITLCGQHGALEKMQEENPVRYQMYQQSRVTLDQESLGSMEKSNTIYTIPVVFHVLHNNQTENISDAQIQDALNILNRDFRKLNSDVNNVVAQFQPIADDAKIEFAFAKIAPNGACFNGITRTVSTATNNSDGEVQVNAIINGNNVYQGIWPHNKYLNIYVCRGLGGSAGYTFLPNGGSTASAANMYYNGIFMLHDYTGSIGTSSVATSRALTHEVGHWLNLKHTWGDGNTPGLASNCSDDDGVTDTPNTRGVTSCNLSENACGPLANVENYMDYSYCSKMFTQGQVTRMRAAIVSSMGGRSNIWSTSNLQAVGVIAGGNSLCGVNIEATETGVCSGASTTFSVSNSGSPITAYSWSFPGGTPSTSTAANPTVTYNTSGTYNVSVTITTASGTNTLNAPNYITVASSQPGVSLPFTEGFSSTVFPPANWTIDNGGSSVTWARRTAGTAPSGAGSAAIDLYTTDTNGDIDDLNTPALNLSGYTGSTLTFDVAYRTYPNPAYYDKLEVLVAAGCGGTYEVVYSKSGTTLQTETANENGYTSPAVWRNETINLSPYVGNNQVKVKFRVTSAYGNYIYIDNVNVSGTTGAATANFSSSTNNVCVGQTVTFTNTSTGATSWNWNFGAGATPATATGAGPHSVSYSTAGNKNVSLSINGGTSTSNQSVTVNQLPTVSMATLPTVCVYHNPITLTQGSPAGGTYSGPGVTGNQFSPSAAGMGTKTITYTYTSAGCTNTATRQIVVDGCLGLETEENTLFNVYPNPTSGDITITGSVAIDEIIVMDNVGRIVEVVNGEKLTEIKLNLGHLSAGSYHIQTQSGTVSKMIKLIIQ